MTTILENQVGQENVFISTEEYHYTFVNISIYPEWEDCVEAGTITLYNIISKEEEEFTIWCGNEEGSYFYICMPTGDPDEYEEEILDLTSFKGLSKSARKAATLAYVKELEKTFTIPVTFLEAYRTLMNANHVYLYNNCTGELLTDGGYVNQDSIKS